LKKWNVGQQIREEGPQAHMVKRGTPTMGGVLIVGSVLISTLLWARLSSVYVWTAMVATLLFAAVGFIDDYAKMAKQRSLGLTGRQKLLAQLLIAGRAEEYAEEWKSRFALRIRAASLFAHLAMNGAGRFAGSALLRTAPGLLDFGARISGKAPLAA
jgi:phospho-N-acetylmuramoyl-pentapeptide-transferase